MKSKWFEFKEAAIRLRKQGYSMSKIEKKLGIARSTLSGWFKKVKLTPSQRKKLLKNSKNALVEARKKAVIWHNKQKQKRIEEAECQALNVLNNINIEDKHILELALSVLYISEGGKTTDQTAIGSSDPLILRFFLSSLKKIYNIDIGRIYCELHLRADQNPEETKKFWAKELNIPLISFRRAMFDKRTIGSRTYPSYKGVCVLRCGNVAVQRRLLFLSRYFCKKIVDAGS